jgi:hypothetical protein
LRATNLNKCAQKYTTNHNYENRQDCKTGNKTIGFL